MEWQVYMTRGRMSSGTYIRIGSSFYKQAVNKLFNPPGVARQARGVETDVGRAGRCSRLWSAVVLCQQAPEPPRRKRADEKEIRTKCRRQTLPTGPERMTALHDCVVRGLGPLLPIPVGVRMARCKSPNWNSAAASKVSKPVVVTNGTSVGGENRKKRVPPGSTRSRLDDTRTVGTDDAAGLGTITTAGGDRSRKT